MSSPSDVHTSTREITEGAMAGRHGVPVWALTIIMAAALAFLSLIEAVGGMAKLVVLVTGLVALGLAGWVWGCDSRDGADWRGAQGP